MEAKGDNTLLASFLVYRYQNGKDDTEKVLMIQMADDIIGLYRGEEALYASV